MKRTPIKRKTPLKTKTPLRSTPGPKRSSTKRKLTASGRPACSVRGCTKRVEVRVSDDERYCQKHALEKADDACRAWFHEHYRGGCVACGRSDRGVQWAHLHTRGMRYIRWDVDNAVGLCSGCHFAYTKSTARWVKFVESNWPGLYVRLLHRELWGDRVGGHVDKAEIIRTYRAGVPWRMPDPPPGVFVDSGETPIGKSDEPRGSAGELPESGV